MARLNERLTRLERGAGQDKVDYVVVWPWQVNPDHPPDVVLRWPEELDGDDQDAD